MQQPGDDFAHGAQLVGQGLVGGAQLTAVAQACEEKHLDAGADPSQIAFEIHALILALHYEARFMRRPGSLGRAQQGFVNILQRYGA